MSLKALIECSLGKQKPKGTDSPSSRRKGTERFHGMQKFWYPNCYGSRKTRTVGHTTCDWACDWAQPIRWFLLEFDSWCKNTGPTGFTGFSVGLAVVCRPPHPWHAPLMQLLLNCPLDQLCLGALFQGWSFLTYLRIFFILYSQFLGWTTENRDGDKNSQFFKAPVQVLAHSKCSWEVWCMNKGVRTLNEPTPLSGTVYQSESWQET